MSMFTLSGIPVIYLLFLSLRITQAPPLIAGLLSLPIGDLGSGRFS